MVDLREDTIFKMGDMILVNFKDIAMVIKSDQPKYNLIKVKIYHPSSMITTTTISTKDCYKFIED